MSIRLNRAISEVNIGLQTTVDFLEKKAELGEVKDDLNFKLNDAQYDALVVAFKGDKEVRTQAEKIFQKKEKPAKKEKPQPTAVEPQQAKKAGDTLIAKKAEVKPLGKIDLGTGKPAAEAPAKAEPKAVTETPKAEEKPVYLMNQYDVFISYSRKDSDVVLPIVKKLEDNGLSVWIDRDGIESGDAFKSVIVRAIKNSDVFLFFSSKNSNQSPWTIKEVNTAVHLKKSIIPIRLDDTDYDDSLLFDLVGLDFVDLSIDEKKEAALNKLINTLLSKISNIVVKQPNKEPNIISLTNKKGFEVGYDLAVFTIHKLRGQTSEKDEDLIAQRLTKLNIDPKTLLGNLCAGTMVPNLSNCALRLGEIHGKYIENSICLGALFALSVIAKRSNISEEFGHSYDKGIVVACQRLSIPDSFTEKLIKSTDDGMEEMLGELKGMLNAVGKDHTALLTAEECYKKGIDCFESKKFEEAAFWFRGSAEKGNASAQCYLGYLYENGIGVEKSNIEAAKWYLKAAEQGNTLAQNNLGSMYREGKGVQKNVDESARWFRVAAVQGHVLAQYNLAIMYQIGAGVKQDEAEAVKWYREAANQGLPQAQYNLGNMYRTGNSMKEKDEKEAVEWFKKAAEQGFADAQHNLGYMYYNGCGVEKDVDEAVKWLNKAAAQGHNGAKSALKLIQK